MSIIPKSETFEVHDKKGNKTGKSETETKYFLKYQNKEIDISNDRRVYIGINEAIDLIFGKYDGKYEYPEEGFGVSHVYDCDKPEDYYLGFHTYKKNLSLAEITKIIDDVTLEFETLGIFNVNIEVHFLAYTS